MRPRSNIGGLEGGPLRNLVRRVGERRGGRWGVAVILVTTAVAVSADFLASDKPILARVDGQLFLLPNLFDPVELRSQSNQSLLASMGADDWIIPPLVPWGMAEQDKGTAPLDAPSQRHWLGTDTARRDVLARLIHGTRVSMTVGIVSVLVYVVIGTILGLFAAYYGGWIDAIISRLIETVMAIPVFFLILATMGVIENAGIGAMMVVIGLVYWTRVARLVRAEALRVRALEFVDAAVALGLSSRRIIFIHILPNTLGPILVTAAFGIAGAVLVEASLSFLGFGTPDSTASWGGLLRAAMSNFHAWWLVVFPGAAIFTTVVAFNLTGEALRDALDPRLQYERGRQEVV